MSGNNTDGCIGLPLNKKGVLGNIPIRGSQRRLCLMRYIILIKIFLSTLF